MFLKLINNDFIRNFTWRFSRKIYLLSRREAINGIQGDGELKLIESVLKHVNQDSNIIFLDVGAHLGEWSQEAGRAFTKQNKQGEVFAFEPAKKTYDYLKNKFSKTDLVSIQRIAFSNRRDQLNFYVSGNLQGTNSFTKSEGTEVEIVECITIDDFIESKKIKSVTFIKTDTEGHDFNIIQGGEKSLVDGKILFWQFEYNHRWINERYFLKDVFDFLQDKPYVIGKVYSTGVELINEWHPELERFFEANYILIKKGIEFEKSCKPMKFNHQNVLSTKLPNK